jgi:aspartokinase-like uncharacterized kinase
MNGPESPRAVVKVGGSLFDLPDLGTRLAAWLEALDTRHVLIVPGGGPTADVVRALDRCHGLGEEASHCLALRAVALNAHFLADLIAGIVVDSWEPCPSFWRAGRIPILDAERFIRADEGSVGALPHNWDVTSDSIAARAAFVGGAARIYLLKSVTVPKEMDSSKMSERGFVDRFFAQTIGSACDVRFVNFRNGKP